MHLELPVISLLALMVAIIVSCFSRINVGVLSIAFALVIGIFFGGMKIQDIVSGFPAGLFLTLVGVTFLFAQARVNGTLDNLSHRAIKLARGNAGMIPVIFFFITFLIAAAGPGNIATTALIAPVAMAVAGRAGISGFLMAIMVCNGATAAAFSPLAPTGIIAGELMAKAGLPGFAWQNFLNTFAAQSFVAFSGYFLLGGARLFGKRTDHLDLTGSPALEPAAPLDARQKLTLAVICGLVLSVVVFKIDVTIGAFAGGVVLSAFRVADEKKTLELVPWNTILMVCGMTILITLMDKTGGMDLFTSILARFSTQASVTGVIAFVTGVISVYSSSSGVVLPAFLSTIPGLVEKLGGGDPLSIAYSINVGAHLVDTSPLSTVGALCIASAAAGEDREGLFYKMLWWGLSMCVVGAVVCFVFFGLLR